MLEIMNFVMIILVSENTDNPNRIEIDRNTGWFSDGPSDDDEDDGANDADGLDCESDDESDDDM